MRHLNTLNGKPCKCTARIPNQACALALRIPFQGSWLRVGFGDLNLKSQDRSPRARNLVMSLGFLGSALGSMFFGWLCDKIGCVSDRKRESCMVWGLGMALNSKP